ncbi:MULTISPECIES: Holliday junction resolvase RuvX [Methylomonas]|uniref:Putative pre-16S rRNA nuclease n=2 Tax=Methylomonas TaxID=416 RepID=A0A126T4X6_9GAMM|nr:MULTISPECIES: Holliday junction resolvase RuvX [Methylomonas]AMK77127.1 Holliday junction resolvase [Methylomonas denitrificans]OAH97134.1 Holliday junction resolvase [Methylomonas methanica]TCV82638.1 putative Holliday junction resolvase [Methylomonas methanica]
MVKVDPLAAKFSSDAYLGFDFGNKKIGVAVGHADTGIASPLQTIQSLNQVPDWHKISQLIAEWRPIGLVVGISRQSDGSDNVITPRMQKFCRQLNGRYNLPVHQIDETLTTFAAKQMLFDDLKVSAAKLWAVQDQLAAQIILQSWFDK